MNWPPYISPADRQRLLLPAESDWVPCEERLPPKGVSVLVWAWPKDALNCRVLIAHYDPKPGEPDDWQEADAEAWERHPASHWRPLPLPPKGAL